MQIGTKGTESFRYIYEPLEEELAAVFNGFTKGEKPFKFMSLCYTCNSDGSDSHSLKNENKILEAFAKFYSGSDFFPSVVSLNPL